MSGRSRRQGGQRVDVAHHSSAIQMFVLVKADLTAGDQSRNRRRQSRQAGATCSRNGGSQQPGGTNGRDQIRSRQPSVDDLKKPGGDGDHERK